MLLYNIVIVIKWLKSNTYALVSRGNAMSLFFQIYGHIGNILHSVAAMAWNTKIWHHCCPQQ